MSRSVVSLVTVASHTCVVRPRCKGEAVAVTSSPSLALDMNCDEQSIVVKPLAPSGQWWLTPNAHSASASAITTGAHRYPVPGDEGMGHGQAGHRVAVLVGQRHSIPSRFKN